METLEDEIFKSKLEKLYGNSYDYSLVKYINKDTPIRLICNKCKNVFLIKPSLLIRGKVCSCSYEKPIRVNTKDGKEDFIKKAIKKYSNTYNYDKVIYKNLNTNVIITCTKHGDFLQTPYNHLISKHGGCKKCLRDSYGYTFDNFVTLSNKLHNNKYDYSKVNFVDMHTTVTIICPEHGEFIQTPYNHINSKTSCKQCRSKHLTKIRSKPQDKLIEEFKVVHGDKYDYSKVNYINSYTDIIIICKIHGEFKQRPNGHLSGSICPKCAKASQTKTNETFLQQLKKYRGDEFNYNKTNYINANTKVIVTCPKHGDLEVAPGHLLFNKNPFQCPDCVLEKKQKSFIDRARFIHGDKYDYSKSVYIKNRDKLEIICPEHGSFWQAPNNHLAGSGCKLCKSSTPELNIYKILRSKNIDVEQEHKLSGFNYRYDFYLPKYNILIEYHGEQHFYPEFYRNMSGGETFEERQIKDKFKILLAKEKDIPLIVLSYKDDKMLETRLLNELNNVYKYKYNGKYFRNIRELFNYIAEETGNTNITKEDVEQYKIDKIID